MPTPTLPSLRERKRSQTWAALHEAALRLALSRDDLQQVTVEAIAEAANVSPRTFFNYFSCKEDAVLGIHEPAVDEATTARFAGAGDDELLEDVARLMFEVSVGGSLGTGEAHQRQREALCRHPQLGHRQFRHVMKTEQVVVQVVADWLRRSPKWQAEPVGADPEEAARVLVMMAGATVRLAIRELAEAPVEDDEHAALSRAVFRFKEMARKVL